MIGKHIMHGAGHEPWYSNWMSMVRRMTYPQDPAYKIYVIEKGLEIDEEFVTNPWAFYKEIGEYPGNGYSIDRIDNTKGYVKGNLRWATPQEQALNKGLYKNNKSGVPGIGWNQEKRRWDARIYRYKKTIFVGLFENLSDAITARKERLEQL